MPDAAAISPRNGRSGTRARPAVKYSTAMPARKAAIMPTPPPFGGGCACELRAVGWSRVPSAIMRRTMLAESRARMPAKSR